MNSELEKGIEEQEAFRLEISGKIKDMIAQNVPLHEIVAMFGAEDFLIEEKRGKHTSIRFNVDGFVSDLIQKREYLKCPKKTFQVGEVFVPPNEGEIKTGNGEGLEQKRIIPRSKYLMEVLDELNEGYILGNGKNDSKMMRNLSYQVFVIPGLEKAVLVNNEEGNATFIYHHDSENVKGEDDYKNFAGMSEEELIQFGREFAEKYSKEDLKEMKDRVSILIYSSDSEKWKEKIKELIINPIPKIEGKEEESNLEFEISSDGMSTSEIAKVLGMKTKEIRSKFSVEKKNNPDKFYSRKKGKMNISIASPEIAKKIIRYFRIPKALPGWKTINELKDELGVDFSTVEKRVKRFGEIGKTIRKFRGKRGAKNHLSPELIKIISDDIGSTEVAPDNYKSLSSLAKELEVDISNLRSIIETNNLEQHIRPFRTKGSGQGSGIPGDHVSIEIINKIKELIKLVDEAGEEDMTVLALAEQLGKDGVTVKKRVKKYAREIPGSYRPLKTKEGPVRMHLSKELIDRIKEDFKK